jgi:hypothetical protein
MFPVDETFKGVKHAGVTYSINLLAPEFGI